MMITGMDGLYAVIFSSASMPLILAMRTSINTRSTGSDVTSATASAPSSAVVSTIPPTADNGLECDQMAGIIVHDQYFGRLFCIHAFLFSVWTLWQGKRSVKVAPFPGVLSTFI